MRALRVDPEIADPEMVRDLWSDYSINSWLTMQNGGYVNPPNDPHPVKRQFRDPYHPWWDKQERRDFGEPVHEDNDIMGVFSLYEYTHMSPARGLVLWGCFIAAVLGLSLAVKQYYPDRPSAPKEYPDGLEAELGGPHALRVSKQSALGKINANPYTLGLERR